MMAEEAVPQATGWFARLRQKVVAYASTRYATLALGVVAFIDGSVFPIPPFALMLPMLLAQPKRAVRYILIGTGASLLGGLVGYGIGYAVAQGLTSAFHIDPALPIHLPRFGIETTLREVLTTNFWILSIACSILPTPYKVVAIGSGVVGVALPAFFMASVLGRFARFIGFTFIVLGARAGAGLLRR
jgi:membrane protein YqaA with SNARE-associated domain